MQINQDNTLVAIAKDGIFSIYSIDPFHFISSTDIGYNIQCVEMFLKSNILAIIGSDLSNKLILWDDCTKKQIGCLIMTNPILRVKLSVECILLVCLFRTYLYDFYSLQRMESIETIKNKKALGVLCQHSCNKLFVSLNTISGEVQLNFYDNQSKKTIKAHKNKIYCVALNFEGTRLATASKTGTIIRIFDCLNLNQLHELRRGSEVTRISSLAFHETSLYLVATSNSKSIHIFHLAENLESLNPKSYFSFLKSSIFPIEVNNLFGREWSFQRFFIHNQPLFAVFGAKDCTLCVFTNNNIYYKIQFGINVEPFQLQMTRF